MRNTPLMAAVLSGNRETVELALDAGADPNGRGMMGRTCMHWAALLQDDKLDLLDLLAARGADVNATSWDGSTPLMTAAMMGKASAVKKLLDLGADPAIEKGYGETALTEARAGKADPEVIKLLSAQPTEQA